MNIGRYSSTRVRYRSSHSIRNTCTVIQSVCTKPKTMEKPLSHVCPIVSQLRASFRIHPHQSHQRGDWPINQPTKQVSLSAPVFVTLCLSHLFAVRICSSRSCKIHRYIFQLSLYMEYILMTLFIRFNKSLKRCIRLLKYL